MALNDEMNKPEHGGGRVHSMLTQWWRVAEDGIYVGVAVMLVATAAAVLASAVGHFAHALVAGGLGTEVLHVLDSLLLVLMMVEILHTVGISIRQHELQAEPFLIVGLIAAVRRILIITAEQSQLLLAGDVESFKLVILELGLLAVMIFTLVLSLFLLTRRHEGAGEKNDSQEVAR